MVLRFLIIQEAGRHALNWKFREALSMQKALLRLGHEAVVWGLGYPDYAPGVDSHRLVEEDKPDVLLLLENYDQTGWVPDFSWFPGPRAFWSIDAHCSLDQHLQTAARLKATHVLCSSYGYLDKFRAIPIPNVMWFPNAYDDDLVGSRAGVQKDHLIGFCGNYVNRQEWIDRLNGEFGIKRDIFVIGEAMVKAVNSYQVHFNRNMADDINYRTFETTGCGTALLTNYTPGLERLFSFDPDPSHPQNEIFVYRDWDHLVRIVGELRTNPGLIEDVAAHGYARTRMEHTYLERGRQLCQILSYTA